MNIVYMFFCGHMFSLIWRFGKEIYCWKPFEKQPNSPAEQLHFCIFLSAICESSNFSQSVKLAMVHLSEDSHPTFLTVKLVIVHLSQDSHPTWELMPHCGLGLHFPVTMMLIIFFHMIVSQLCIFFGNISIEILCLPFKITFQGF